LVFDRKRAVDCGEGRKNRSYGSTNPLSEWAPRGQGVAGETTRRLGSSRGSGCMSTLRGASSKKKKGRERFSEVPRGRGSDRRNAEAPPADSSVASQKGGEGGAHYSHRLCGRTTQTTKERGGGQLCMSTTNHGRGNEGWKHNASSITLRLGFGGTRVPQERGGRIKSKEGYLSYIAPIAGEKRKEEVNR